MANTAPFSCPLGINVASNFVVNTTTLSTTGLWANSQGINADSILASVNVLANTIQANTVTHLNLIANLISMNVLTGNIATIKQLIANQCFVNSTSGNNATFLSVTANQVMVNTMTANTYTSVSDLTLTNYSSETVMTFGNATNYTQIAANGVWFADAAGFAKHMPAEVLLQKGTVTSAQNFTVNFSNEVNSNNFISMKLVLKFYVNGGAGSDYELDGQFCADGSTPTTSGYRTGIMYTSDSNSPYVDGVAADSNESGGHMTIGYIDNYGNSTSQCYHYEVFFPDTLNRSANKAVFSRGISFFNTGFGEATIMHGGAWHSSMNLKGFKVFLSDTSFSLVNWALVGIKA